MKTVIKTYNAITDSLMCRGIYFYDTKEISLKDLILFIERDVHLHLKKYTNCTPKFTVSMHEIHGSTEFKIVVSIHRASLVKQIKKEIEDIVWAYNQQTMLHDNGRFRPLPPRFIYQINVSNVDTTLRLAE